jgi:hypothetical protein
MPRISLASRIYLQDGGATRPPGPPSAEPASGSRLNRSKKRLLARDQTNRDRRILKGVKTVFGLTLRRGGSRAGVRRVGRGARRRW